MTFNQYKAQYEINRQQFINSEITFTQWMQRRHILFEAYCNVLYNRLNPKPPESGTFNLDEIMNLLEA